jgi:putative oxidoreductase
VVFALDLLSGALLLANGYVPFALMLLGAVVANTALFQVLMSSGTPDGVIVTALWVVVFFRVWPVLAGMFRILMCFSW